MRAGETDTLTGLAENIECVITSLFVMLRIRGYTEDDIAKVAGEQQDASRDIYEREWPADLATEAQ